MNSTFFLQLHHLHTLDIYSNRVHSIAISTNNKYLVTGGGNDPGKRNKSPTPLQIWDCNTGNYIHFLNGHDADINAVAISPDDKKIISVSNDSTIRVWNLATGKQIYEIGKEVYPIYIQNHKSTPYRNRKSTSHQNQKSTPYYAVAIHPNKQTFVAATSSRNNPTAFSLATGKELYNLISPYGNSSCSTLMFSSDGNLLIGGSKSNCIVVWELNSQTRLVKHKLVGHNLVGNSLCISPDSKTLVSGGDQRIKAWDLETGKAELSFYGHADLVRGVVITPDGKNLISAGDRFIKIWDLETGKKLNTIEAHDDAIRALTLSSDGTILASGGVGGKVKIWKVI